MNNRAFIVGTPSYNFDENLASEFGDVVHLNSQRPSMFDTSYFYKWFLKEMEDHKFNPKSDYLLIAGSHVMSVVCVSALIAKYGYVCTLLYSSSKGEYVPRELGNCYKGIVQCSEEQYKMPTQMPTMP